MTKILLITNKTDITTDFIVSSLHRKNVLFYRLNTEEIGLSVQVSLNFQENRYVIIDRAKSLVIDLLKITSVYFRRPEINNHFDDLSLGERNFVKSEFIFLLEGIYKILNKAFWINTVSSIRNAENKIYQLLIAKSLDLEIPRSIITNVPVEAEQFTLSNETSIIKPIKSGLVEGDREEGVIFTSSVTINKGNAKRVERCPVYLQNLIPKKGDIRVTVVGKKVFSAFIHSQESDETRVDWRKSNVPLQHSHIDLPQLVKQKCVMLTEFLSLNFAAIDFILDTNGNYTFLEVNANGQWAWIERQLNLNISDEITSLLVENQGN